MSVSCLFASDLHGRVDRYDKLCRAIAQEAPGAVFLGGDLLPHHASDPTGRFLQQVLGDRLRRLRDALAARYPRVFTILGNDDPAVEEDALGGLERDGLLEYLQLRRAEWAGWTIYGYACVPPTPFLLKDWEVYDVSRYVDPGCVSPEEGHRSRPVSPEAVRYRTIAQDLDALVPPGNLDRTIMLFHAPPYGTVLDRAALDGRTVDHVPMDVHIGSLAIQRFIESRQPRVTLHGHVHESARLTGAWRQPIGRTWIMTAAHDGPELALVRFDPDDPAQATREWI